MTEEKWPDFETLHNATIDALYEENKRLRAALQQIAEDDDVCPAGHAIAQSALNQQSANNPAK